MGFEKITAIIDELVKFINNAIANVKKFIAGWGAEDKTDFYPDNFPKAE